MFFFCSDIFIAINFIFLIIYVGSFYILFSYLLINLLCSFGAGVTTNNARGSASVKKCNTCRWNSDA